METEEPVLFVLENAVFQSASLASMKIQVGDLFVTQERLCFVPYASTTTPGTAGPAAAFLLGGVAGAAAASSTNNSYRDAGIRIANKQRKQFWGMSLTKRMKLHTNSIAIPRNEILDIKVRLGTISLFTGKSHITFAIDRAKEQKDKLSKWCNGEFGAPSACAVTSKYLAPYLAFTASFEGNQGLVIVDQLNKASSDTDYMKHLWTVYELLPKERRQRVIKLLEQFEGPFTKAFEKLRQRAIASGKNVLAIGFFTLIVGAISSVPFVEFLVFDARSGRDMSFLGLFSFVVLILSLIGGVGLIYKGYRATRI